MLEFRQFCERLYGGKEDPILVTEEQTYRFLSYHAHRTKLILKKESKTQIKLCKDLIGRIMSKF